MFNPYLWLILVILYVTTAIAGYGKGHHDAELNCHEAELRAQVTSMQDALREQARQAEAAQEITDQANARTQQAEQARKNLEDQANAYADELAKRPDGKCSMSADDVRRLRNIRPARPAGH